MVRDEIRASGEIQPGVLNPAENMKARPANIGDSMGENRMFRRASPAQVLVITQLLQPQSQRVAHRRAPRHGAIARPPGNKPARGAGINELLGHGKGRLVPQKYYKPRAEIPARTDES